MEIKEIVRLKRVTSNSFIDNSNLNTKSYTRAKVSFCVGLDSTTGMLKEVLTPEEAEKLEKEFNYEKGRLGKNAPYWKTYEARVTGDDIMFDLSNPKHLLDYKVIVSKKTIVANGLEELKMNPAAEWVFTSDKQEAEKSNAARKFKTKAYAKFNSMSINEMRDYLISIGKKPNNTSSEMVENILGDEIEADPRLFLEKIEDPYYKQKIFINTCISLGVLRTSANAVYYNQDKIGETILDAIDFLLDKKNNEVLLSIKGDIERIEKQNKK